MAEIVTTPGYRIIKCCGDNSGDESLAYIRDGKCTYPSGPDAPVHTFLVEPHIEYVSREAAEKRAIELAKQTPGNRYYVTHDLVGFMVPETAVERKECK